VRNILVLALVFIIPFFIPSDEAYSENTAENAVVITIDGLRPDAISQTNAPNLTGLIKEGAYTPIANTVDPPKTLPSHTSLVTGLVPKKHLTFINEWVASYGYTQFDTIFTIAKEEGFSTAMFAGKDKLNFIAAPGSMDKIEVIEYSLSCVKEISDRFIDYAKNSMPRVSLIHFPEPDITGHKNGWMSEEYMISITRVDLEIGEIIKFLKKQGMYGKTFIVITADHGGKGTNHKVIHPEVMTIPWLAVGENVKQNYAIKEQVYIYDTAPTVLKALGLPELKNIDGHAVDEIFMHQ
jgi:predicted AlkP superfamily pyrophosphatase or phosphodiesterase